MMTKYRERSGGQLLLDAESEVSEEPLNLGKTLWTRSQQGLVQLAAWPSGQPKAKRFCSISESCWEGNNERRDGKALFKG